MDRPKLFREWVGLRCRLRREISNGLGRIEPGRLVVVTGTHRGTVDVKVEPACPHCGVSWHCLKVWLSDLEPIERVHPAPEPMQRRQRRQRT